MNHSKLFPIYVTIALALMLLSFQVIATFPLFFLSLIIVYTIYYSDSNQHNRKPSKSQRIPDFVPDTTYSGQFMSKYDRNIYFQSREWKALKDIVHLLYSHKCQLCGTKDNLEVHHNTYERLGDELITDLNLLCRDCHQSIHDSLGYDRMTKYPIK